MSLHRFFSHYRRVAVLFVVIWSVVQVSRPAAAQDREPLSNKHQTWYEEEAAYLMTDEEETVWKRLATDAEREHFIRVFWEARDPTPGTARNEFRDRYLERKREANKLFRGYGREGWRTERGRIYMLLGPPKERRNYDEVGELLPIELWFYHSEDPALPDFFYLLFYRKGSVGTFRLWNPVEGPGILFAATTGTTDVYSQQALSRRIQKIDEDLFVAVTTPVPGESSASSIFSFQKVLAVLEDYPNQSLNPEFAGRYNPGRGIVERNYTFQRLDVAPLVAVLPSANGPFLHYALQMEPENLTYKQYEDMFYTVFDLEIAIETTDGETIYEAQDRREIEVPEKRWEEVNYRPVSLQGLIPVIPGDFVVRFTVRNRLVRVFDTIETAIRVPESMEPSLLLPASFFQTRYETRNALAFQVREALAVPHPRNVYPPSAAIRAFMVFPRVDDSGPIGVDGRILEEDEGTEVHHLTQEIGATAEEGPVMLRLEVALGESVTPGDYRLELALSTGIERSLPFRVEPQAMVPPLVNSPEEPAFSDASWELARARQLMALNQNMAALDRVESAAARDPERVDLRAQLGALALALGEPQRALDAIVPGLMHSPFHYELLVLAGFASERLGELNEAADYYERARRSGEPDAKLLGALAGVYEKMGETGKANAVKRQIKDDVAEEIPR